MTTLRGLVAPATLKPMNTVNDMTTTIDTLGMTATTECWYVDDNGEREFYRNRQIAEQSLEEGRGMGWTNTAVVDSMSLSEFYEVYGEDEAVEQIDRMVETGGSYHDSRPTAHEIICHLFQS